MALLTKRAQATVTPGDEPGEFDMLLSNAALDRDGEVLHPQDWAQPLPKSIPINVNHSANVSDVVASGTPFIDGGGNLRVKGTFASTPEAQHIRTLVNEGHVTSVSVEFLRRKGQGGGDVNELVGGAFVNIPSNPQARVLASKGVLDLETFTRQLEAILAGEPDPMAMVTKAAGGDASLLQAIHDASWHLGATCVAPADDVDDGADDGANKAAALRLRLKALSR
jgi:hypothetical protein